MPDDGHGDYEPSFGCAVLAVVGMCLMAAWPNILHAILMVLKQ